MVKNEEKHLDECLKSLMPLLERLEAELIIVDTGSTDNTVEIAQKYTDKVFFHKWNNNFSEMRNITISYCTGEWFFCIDGDEVLDDTKDIIEFFEDNEYKKYNTATLIVKNYLSSKDNNMYNMSESYRLFKKDKQFRYEGRVHNQPIYKYPLKKINTIINHFGYITDDKELMKKKFERTATLLKKELEADPENIYYNYQLAASYSMNGDNATALEYSQKAYLLLKEEEKIYHKNVLIQYAQMLVTNHRIVECEKICEDSLKLIKGDEAYKIDLYYYLGRCKYTLFKFEESIANYEEYLRIYDKYKKGELPTDLTIINCCVGLENFAYQNIGLSYYNLKKYNESILALMKMNLEKNIVNVMNVIVDDFFKMKKFEGLFIYYKNTIMNLSEQTIERFISQIEIGKEDLNKEYTYKIEKIFSEDDSNYGELNKIRIYEADGIHYDFDTIIENLDINNVKSYYGDLLYIAIKKNYNLESITKEIQYDSLIGFIEFCNKKYDDFYELLLEFIKNEKMDDLNFNSLRTNIVFYRTILVLDKINEESFDEIFEKYISLGRKYIELIYSDFVINNVLVNEVKSDEHKFFIYMIKANKVKETNRIEYIKYLKYALKSYPYMKRGIENLLNQLMEQENKRKNEFETLKKAFIKNIDALISDGKLVEAKVAIDEYEKIIGMDMDLLLLKSQIAVDETNVYVN